SALMALPTWGQDPQEYPGLLVVSAPPEEAGAFIAGVCDIGNCLLPPPEGAGPYRLIPVRDPGNPDGNPPSEPDEGCTPFTNGDEVDGNFALIRAGGCLNSDKFFWARQAGAVGVVLYAGESVAPDDVSPLAPVAWEVGRPMLPPRPSLCRSP